MHICVSKQCSILRVNGGTRLTWRWSRNGQNVVQMWHHWTSVTIQESSCNKRWWTCESGGEDIYITLLSKRWSGWEVVTSFRGCKAFWNTHYKSDVHMLSLSRRNIFVIASPNQITWFSNKKECCWSLGLRVQILSRLGCFCWHSSSCFMVAGTHCACFPQSRVRDYEWEEEKRSHPLVLRHCIKYWSYVSSDGLWYYDKSVGMLLFQGVSVFVWKNSDKPRKPSRRTTAELISSRFLIRSVITSPTWSIRHKK
jgi:hypothetical protein